MGRAIWVTLRAFLCGRSLAEESGSESGACGARFGWPLLRVRHRLTVSANG